MKFEGKISSWNEERGFGFITPTQGGQEIFVHIKSFNPRIAKPLPEQHVSFEVELNAQGKKRAKNVQTIRAIQTVKAKPRENTNPARWGTASFFAIPAFVLIYLVVDIIWKTPKYSMLAYISASVICFLAYATDKSAAVNGRWRTPESTLHFLSLACGWPGAIIAQQLLRHKSNKASFRAPFWATVGANIIAFVGFRLA